MNILRWNICSQDTIFRSVVNKDDNTRQHVPNIMVATSVPRRFVTTKKNNIVTLLSLAMVQNLV